MTKYYYIPEEYKRYYDDELQHFDFKIPDVGKFINDIGKNASSAIDSISKGASKVVDDISKNISKAANDTVSNMSKAVSGTLGGFFGREWKNHRWIARKRNKNGKWIYDYGNGFPGEKIISGDSIINRTPDKDIKVRAPSFIQKFMTPIYGLGKLLVGRDAMETIQGGAEFIGGFLEVGKQIKANAAKAGTKKDSHGIALKKQDLGKDYDLKATNPGWDNKDGFSQTNCPLTSVAYDMRRRGYEVTAKQHLGGLSRNQIASFYKNPKIHSVTSDEKVDNALNLTVGELSKAQGQKLTKAVEKQFKTEPDNTRGLACVSWQGGGGHIFAYEKEKGIVKFYDPQSGEKLNVSDYVNRSKEFEYFRTDNLEPDYEQVKKVIE